MSSGTSWPARMIASAFLPISLPAATWARSMSPVESWAMPKVSSSLFACVPLPEPGGPNSTTFISASLFPAAWPS